MGQHSKNLQSGVLHLFSCASAENFVRNFSTCNQRMEIRKNIVSKSFSELHYLNVKKIILLKSDFKQLN